LSNGSCPISEFVDYPDTGKSGIEVSVWHYQLHLKPIIFINVSNNLITDLIFSKNNSLRNLTSDAFKDLNHLRTLELHHEKDVSVESITVPYYYLYYSFTVVTNNKYNIEPFYYNAKIQGTET
jgi:hypothetical protein